MKVEAELQLMGLQASKSQAELLVTLGAKREVWDRFSWRDFRESLVLTTCLDFCLLDFRTAREFLLFKAI